MSRAGLLAAIALASAMPGSAEASGVDHAPWDRLLNRSVNQDGLVNYRELKNHRAELATYLANLATVDPATLSREEQLAFWINAYNACVCTSVLDHQPLASVKEVKEFFDRIPCRVAGTSLTLNQIEAKGRALGDWRIHFAVVCASSSCPALRNEAYTPERLDTQLHDQAARFLNDRSRGLRVDGRVLWVSKIFKWYAKDFVPNGPLTAEALVPVLRPYLSMKESLFPQDLKRLTLKFLGYDWLLNTQ